MWEGKKTLGYFWEFAKSIFFHIVIMTTMHWTGSEDDDFGSVLFFLQNPIFISTMLKLQTYFNTAVVYIFSLDWLLICRKNYVFWGQLDIEYKHEKFVLYTNCFFDFYSAFICLVNYSDENN